MVLASSKHLTGGDITWIVVGVVAGLLLTTFTLWARLRGARAARRRYGREN